MPWEGTALQQFPPDLYPLLYFYCTQGRPALKTTYQYKSCFGSPDSQPSPAPGYFHNTFGLVVHPDSGEIWVSDHKNHRIQIFTPQGSFIRFIGSTSNLPGIHHCPNSNPGGFCAPSGLAFDRDRNLVVAEFDGTHP